MRRPILLLVACTTVPLLSGCVGDTDPASNIRATQAQLNAHGHTNNGPARWWWEYGIGRANVAGGGGTKTSIQGPASSSSDANVSATVKNLEPDQDYFFRACGQDTKAGSTASCGAVRELLTAPADSAVSADAQGHVIHFDAAAGTQHHVTVTDDGTDSEVLVKDPVSLPQTDPPTGSALTSGTNCTTISQGRPFLDVADCTGGTYSTLDANLGPLDDTISLASLSQTIGMLHGGAGNDHLTGSRFGDYLYGDAGNDTLDGGPQSDHMDGGPGDDTYVCDTTGDTAVVDSAAEANRAKAAGCTVVGP